MTTKVFAHKLNTCRYYSFIIVLVLLLTTFGINNLETKHGKIQDQAQTPSHYSNGGIFENLRHVGLLNETYMQQTQDKDTLMLARKDLMKRVCAALHAKPLVDPALIRLYRDEYLKNLLVNLQQKLLYCYLPKESKIKHWLNDAEPVDDDNKDKLDEDDELENNNNKFFYLKNVKDNLVEEIVWNYKKIIVVRHPLVRLLSTYLNKFDNRSLTYERQMFYNRISKFYSDNPQVKREFSETLDYISKSLSFENFLTYWTDTFDTNSYVTEHLVPYFYLCNPCGVPYDFIAKLETLQSDLEFMSKKNKLQIPSFSTQDFDITLTTDELLEEYFERIPEHLIKKIWNILKYDFLMFGYNLPHWFKLKLNSS